MRILYLHWDEQAALRDQASVPHDHVSIVSTADGFLRWLELGPEVVVIHLGLHPAHGRELGHHVRGTLVFVGGVEEDVMHAMQRYPAALFCDEFGDVPHEIEALDSQTWSA